MWSAYETLRGAIICAGLIASRSASDKLSCVVGVIEGVAKTFNVNCLFVHKFWHSSQSLSLFYCLCPEIVGKLPSMYTQDLSPD